MSNLNTPEGRAQEIKLRRLEIAATLAEWKHAYFAEGIERPMADRAALEAEDARLALEARRISSAAVLAQAERRRREKADLLAQLLDVLQARGLHDVIEEAQARTAAAETGS